MEDATYMYVLLSVFCLFLNDFEAPQWKLTQCHPLKTRLSEWHCDGTKVQFLVTPFKMVILFVKNKLCSSPVQVGFIMTRWPKCVQRVMFHELNYDVSPPL